MEMNQVEAVRAAFLESSRVLTAFVHDESNIIRLDKMGRLMADIFKRRARVFICGNGGSHCDAMHFAEELTGRFRKDRGAYGAMALGDAAHITCTANDYGFDEIFARGVDAFGQEGDLLIGLSTSGNSENVLRALKKAKELKLKTAAFLGKGGGKISGLCDFEWIAEGQTSDRIQEVHMAALHIVIEAVERYLHPELY
jgi:D-sedoheptulose 7-phosphate isomerase